MSLVITHRGLQPTKVNFPPESSLAAFKIHIEAGYNIEFDLNFAKDTPVVCHDHSLSRLSNQQSNLKISTIPAKKLQQYHIPTLASVLELIQSSSNNNHALHLKGPFQTTDHLAQLLELLTSFPRITPKLFLFDLKPKAAEFLKNHNPDLRLAPSIAHPYDIHRYNSSVGGTLLTLEMAIQYKSLYNHAWLDEWDRTDVNSTDKTLYTEHTMASLLNAGLTSFLVAPELHGSSPSLLGGESHPDASPERWSQRMNTLIDLSPAGICTDFPEEVSQLFLEKSNCV